MEEAPVQEVNKRENITKIDLVKDLTVFNIFPNPANDMIEIAFNSETINKIYKIEIKDILGTTMMEKIGITKFDNYERLDVFDLQPSIYFVSIAMGDKKRTVKVIIAR